MSIDFDCELDVRGLLCPLPILKTRFKIDTLDRGQVLKVISNAVRWAAPSNGPQVSFGPRPDPIEPINFT